MNNIVIHQLEFVKYIKAEVIQKRINELAIEIEKDLQMADWTIVVMLNGAFVFASDLLRNFKVDAVTKFIKLSSYHDLESSGQVHFDKNVLGELKGKKLLLIEDIIDTGTTLNEFQNYLVEKEVAEIKICSLLLKPAKLKYNIQPDYLGFSISDLFVVGYGLDFNERGRGLKDIYILNDATG